MWLEFENRITDLRGMSIGVSDEGEGGEKTIIIESLSNGNKTEDSMAIPTDYPELLFKIICEGIKSGVKYICITEKYLEERDFTDNIGKADIDKDNVLKENESKEK